MIPDPPPKISAILPVFGNMGDVNRLVDQLNGQTLRPHEIIVVDSSPRPLEHSPSGVLYVKNPQDIGLGADINLGAQSASGDYLLIVQQDCLPGNERAI